MNFEPDISNCISVLKSGGLILYPTDTIWGIGCDSTNESAIQKIYTLKKRMTEKSMIILVADRSEVSSYTDSDNKAVISEIDMADTPTTVIYERAKNLPSLLINADGSIAIRIVHDIFCRTLISQFQKPLVATSANISGAMAPLSFDSISEEIKNGVDYIVQHRRDEKKYALPSVIIKLNADGSITKIR
jgi:L-threonylcarbamoyladenylate synthase